ncbi:hypothetical protein ACLQ2S_23745 [Micromonospora sp. DT48]|uniref:hypothetical protein n=1 Tax=unclassified Micromonospora TaxID=2617518 RepID=UPI002814EBAB|nr:hypothetical protein [Micromonospora sp. CP22]
MADALLVPPEDPPDEPPDDPLPEPDEAEADEVELVDDEFDPVELEVEDSDLPFEPLATVSEPEERESVR